MRKIIVSLTGLLMLSACARFPGSHQEQTWDAQVIRGQLSNGLEYRLVPQAAEPGRIDMRLTVKAGSVDEQDDQVGVAHMVEHLNFYSRGGLQDDIRTQMNRWGWVQARNYNAVTSYDRTQYMLTPSAGKGQTDQGLQALATLALAQDYDAANLERERPIVIEEWRGGLGVAQRMNDQRAASQRMGSRYPAHRTIGNEKAIRSAQLASLKAFQQRWYVPNNMLLTIVGDIDPATLPARIEHWFGQAKPGSLPDRDYRELPLDSRLKIARLQDSQSGSNQIALLFRLHEAPSRESTPDGLRERLIDRLTLSMFLDQLRRQPLQPGVRSLTVQKSLIGERSSVLGVAAGVEGDAHAAALRQLLGEIERLRRFGLQAADLQSEKDKIRAIGERMLANDKPRTFEQWVNDLNDAAIQGKVLISKHEIAAQHLAALDSIALSDVNERLKRWTASPDRVLQLSAPGSAKLTLPSVTAVAALNDELRHTPMEAPQPPTPAAAQTRALPPIPAASKAGSVTARQRYDAEQVEYWQLSNGDRLVWLKRNGEQGRPVMQVDSNAGFMSPDLPGWRSQMAVQLAEQSAPHGWSNEQIRRWRSEQGVSLGLNQSAERLQIDVSALAGEQALPFTQRLHNLMQAYRLSQAPVRIEAEALNEARDDLLERLSRRSDNVREQQDQALRVLQFGRDGWPTPTIQALQALEVDELNDDWQRLSRAPVTYYLMADIEPDALEPLVAQQLASIPRGEALHPTAARQLNGQRNKTLAIAIEPRAVLHAVSFHPHPWTPDDAARVAAIKNIANAALKQQLRGEAAGIYRLTFDTTLDPQSERIESRLNFTSDPARVEELWQLARATLEKLPTQITEKEAKAARSSLKKQEQLRRDDPQTQLRRLILSDRHWGDPRYLSLQKSLPDALNTAALKRLAGELIDSRNLVQLRLLPAPVNAVADQ